MIITINVLNKEKSGLSTVPLSIIKAGFAKEKTDRLKERAYYIER